MAAASTPVSAPPVLSPSMEYLLVHLYQKTTQGVGLIEEKESKNISLHVGVVSTNNLLSWLFIVQILHLRMCRIVDDQTLFLLQERRIDVRYFMVDETEYSRYGMSFGTVVHEVEPAIYATFCYLLRSLYYYC